MYVFDDQNSVLVNSVLELVDAFIIMVLRGARSLSTPMLYGGGPIWRELCSSTPTSDEGSLHLV